MSTHVIGFRPADEKWNKMKAIWDSCESADIPIPKEVSRFFDDEDPGDKPGAEVKIDKAVTDWDCDCGEGYEIDVTKLPKDVQFIRFYNSY